MKKREIMKKGLVLVLTASLLLSGCGSKNNNTSAMNEQNTNEEAEIEETDEEQDDEAKVDEEDATEVASTDEDLVKELRKKYDGASTDYSGDVIEISRDESIQIELGYNPYDAELSVSEAYAVYKDAALTQPVDMTSPDWDYETGILTIEPPIFGVAEIKSNSVDLSHLSGNYLADDEGFAWGTVPQYYLAISVDTETGEELDKPVVTMIKVKSEIEQAPQLKFTQTDKGEARFYWKEVEGAEQYLIFRIREWDTGYEDYVEVIAKTEEPEWVCGIYESEGTDSVISMNDEFVYYFTSDDDEESAKQLYEEANLEYEDIAYDEYWSEHFGVIAVNETGASHVSNFLSAKELSHMLPNTYAFHANEDLVGYYDSVMDLPATMAITMCDGSTANKVIDYDYENYTCEDSYGFTTVGITGVAHGTLFSREVYLTDVNKDTLESELEELKKRQEELLNKGGNVDSSLTFDDDAEAPEDDATEDETQQTTEEETKTEDDESDDDEKKSDDESEDDEKKSEDDESDEDEKKSDDESEDDDEKKSEDDESDDDEKKSDDESEDDEKKSDDESEDDDEKKSEDDESDDDEKKSEDESEDDDESKSGVNAGSDIKITANSALSEYIAINMIETNNAIDLSAFPEAADMDVMTDAFFEAQYQNPLILGVKGGKVDTDNNILYVEYDYDADTTAQKQEELLNKIDEVVEDIIDDDMSEAEKELAINEYLCSNAVYDDAALENAEKNDFYYVDEEFNDSFTAYGVLVNGVGVCASYSAAFKMLADAAGLESIVVTGYLDGSLPHAWNKVNIDGEWNIVDSTNNDNDVIPNALFNLSDEGASQALTEDDRFAVDENVYNYGAPSDEREYYRVTGNYYDIDEIAGELAAKLQSEGSAKLRTEYTLDDETFQAIAQEVANTAGMDISGYYWLGVINLMEK